jgi:GxxExxY protein
MNTNEHEYSLSGKIIHGELAYRVIGLAMEVPNKLGVGFLEKVYENALLVALKRESIAAQQQAPIEVHFDGVVVGEYIADLLVDGKLILELKAVEAISDIHRAQTINYLRATKLHLAIIINFARPKLEYERVVL